VSTFIIAEAGANHNRSLQQAFSLIDTAIAAKANAVKFQTYSSETLYSSFSPDFAGYKNITKLIKDIELPREWQSVLKQYCEDNNIEFMSTPFDEKAVDELHSLNVKRLKIAGFEATDPRFVKYVASTGLPLIISLGTGANISTMTTIYSWVKEENANPEITFLHCNNAYPTPFKDINLGQIKKMIDMKPGIGVKIGLSDHTEGVFIPPVAVALGAQTVEKHFTLSKRMPGPDHPFAIEPNELIKMVKDIRLVESTLGVKKEKYTDSEKDFSKARRSVVVSKNVKKGEKITEYNVTTKRPLLEDSIPAEKYYSIIGKTFVEDLVNDCILKWEHICE